MTTPTRPARRAEPEPDIALAERLFSELRASTQSGVGITRASYGPGEQAAHDIVRREAETLGLHVATDAASNLYVTLEGQSNAPALVLGSHLDSVPRGGNFDGAAGVLLGLSVMAGYRQAGIRPPRDITLMAIRAEESTWFGASYIGSRAAFGRLAPAELEEVRRMNDGMALGTAIDAAGGDTSALRSGKAFLDPERIGVFLEPHIEQGPVLVTEGLPVGIVTGIRGSFRHRESRCYGTYAHSGATPRDVRRDAVRAVATLVVEMDRLWQRRARSGDDLTVTFGQLATDPDEAAFSKVAGEAAFTLDVRSASAATLGEVQDEMQTLIGRIEADQGVRFDMGPLTGSDPAEMDAEVRRGLCAAAAEAGVPSIEMACGAGHDAAVFAQLGVPTGMVFIRNENGSHNPDEAMTMADFAEAAHVISHFCVNPAGARQ